MPGKIRRAPMGSNESVMVPPGRVPDPGAFVTSKNPDEIRSTARKFSAADYAGTIRSFYPFWDSMYRPFLLGAVEALPTSGFHWKPRPEMFTAHQIIVHIAEC